MPQANQVALGPCCNSKGLLLSQGYCCLFLDGPQVGGRGVPARCASMACSRRRQAFLVHWMWLFRGYSLALVGDVPAEVQVGQLQGTPGWS